MRCGEMWGRPSHGHGPPGVNQHMTEERGPAAHAAADLNCGLSSGAPPVMSSVRRPPRSRASSASSRHRTAVARSIASVRSGELSTWQWLHACGKFTG